MKKITLEIPDEIYQEIAEAKKYLKQKGISINDQSIIIMALWLAYQEHKGVIQSFFDSPFGLVGGKNRSGFD